MNDTYEPPYKLTPSILKLVGEITEWIGMYSIISKSYMTPKLRKEK